MICYKLHLLLCIVFLNLKFVNSEKEIVIDITNILPCIINLTSKDYGQISFLFIAEEVQNLKSSNIIFQHISKTVLIQRIENFVGWYGFFILFPTSNKSYSQLLRQIQPNIYNKFLIVWPYYLDTDILEQFIRQFWDNRLLSVVILSRETDVILNVFTYSPYIYSHCNEPRIILTDVWNMDQKKFVIGSDIYTLVFERMKNLNGCPLICFAKNRPPDSIVLKISNEWKLDGIGGKLMEEVRKRYNFTSIIQVPTLSVTVDKYGYDISDGYPELVSTRLNNYSVDLAFGIYSHIIYDNPKTEFTTSVVSECYGWAVPAHSGKMIPGWMYYTNEFTVHVWLLILLGYLTCTTALYIVLGLHQPGQSAFRSLTYVALYILCFHLGISVAPRIRYMRARILISIILFYSLIIYSAYQSSLGSFLTVPWKREQINTFREIVEGNYEVRGQPQANRILGRSSKDNPVLKILSDRFQTHTDHFSPLLERIYKYKNTVTFSAQRFIQFYISNELNVTNRDDIYLLPTCVIQAHASPFLLKKGSPFLYPLNRIIEAAVESGLNDFWYQYSTPQLKISPFSDILPLSVYQLRSAFSILIIGMSLAIVTFIAELKIHRLQTKKVDVFQNQKFTHETEIKLNNRKQKFVFRGRYSCNKN